MKTIDGLTGYLVTEDGRVFSEHTNKFRALGSKSNSGYLQLVLKVYGKRKFVYIHRLVATAFVPNPENKTEVNHKNGNKEDNRAENLEWVTSSENKRHAIGVLKRAAPYRKLTEEDVACIRFFSTAGKRYWHNGILAKIFGVHKNTISRISRRADFYA